MQEHSNIKVKKLATLILIFQLASSLCIQSGVEAIGK